MVGMLRSGMEEIAGDNWLLQAFMSCYYVWKPIGEPIQNRRFCLLSTKELAIDEGAHRIHIDVHYARLV